jgi:hypothetical protein
MHVDIPLKMANVLVDQLVMRMYIRIPHSPVATVIAIGVKTVHEFINIVLGVAGSLGKDM